LQQMQDPVVQMQQQELAIRGKEAEAKVQKVMTDAALKEKDLALREREMMMRAEQADQELALKAEIEGTKLGTTMMKDIEKTKMEKGRGAK
jgi:hypothetical protein